MSRNPVAGSPKIIFDARTIGDHYPGIGRYAYGVWQALSGHIQTTWIDPALTNTRFRLSGPTAPCPSIRSPLAQIRLPQPVTSGNIYYSPYWLHPYTLPCPSVITLYDATPLYGRDISAPYKIIFRLAHWLTGLASDRILVMSESAQSDMLALGVPAKKIRVCPPGLDPQFHPTALAEQHHIKRKYDLPDEFWLCFGSTRWHKNTLAAIQALQGRTLVIVGNYNEAALRQSALAGLWAGGEPSPAASPTFTTPARVISFVDEADLPALYSVAKGLVFPSLREGFGLPIVEAMACGTPVACLPAPGVREAAGDAASMADELTTPALAQAIQRLEDAHYRTAKRQAGFEWVNGFTWDKTVQAITSLSTTAREDSPYL